MFWIEYYDTIYPKVDEFKFITKVKLNMNEKKLFNIAYCYNTGLMLAEGKYFTILDPCLWFPPDFFEKVYSFHEERKKSIFTHNLEIRSKNKDYRFLLTENYFSSLGDFYIKKKSDKIVKKNIGCCSTSLLKNYLEVDGFDIFESKDTLLDRSTLRLCMHRMINKLKIKRVPLKFPAFHSWHPTEEDPIDKKFIKNKLVQVMNNKGIVNAEKGLPYMRDKFEIKKDSGILYLEEK